MFNYGTKENPILKRKDLGISFRFDFCGFGRRGTRYYRVYYFSQKSDAWVFLTGQWRGPRETNGQLFDSAYETYAMSGYECGTDYWD